MKISKLLAAVFILIGLASGYAIAIAYQKKASVSPQKPPQQESSPQQSPSCLEDKMWYEAEMDFLFKFNEKLIAAFGLQDVIQCITEAAHDFLAVERAVFLTWDKASEKFTLAYAVGWNYDRHHGPVLIDKDSISGLVIHNREPLVVADIAQDWYLKKLRSEEYLQKAFISAPLIFKDEVLGVLHVCDKRTPGPFTQREVSVVMNIVRMGAVTLQNVRLHEQTSKRAAELKIAYDELKEMQSQLIQAEKLKAIGQLASGVAHEMRNPIATIIQGVAYLEQIVPQETKEQSETISILKDSAQRADKIVVSLLDYSRPTKLELHPERIDSILQDSLNLVKTELRNIEVRKEIQEGLPEVTADKNKLMQVFINLFMNAIHAMPEGGKLTVRSFLREPEEMTGKAVVIEIEDTGAGISEANLKRIFDPFFTTKSPGKGTGLGLSVSRNIIMLHKGQIEVKSQPGKGTKALVTLTVTGEEANG